MACLRDKFCCDWLIIEIKFVNIISLNKKQPCEVGCSKWASLSVQENCIFHLTTLVWIVVYRLWNVRLNCNYGTKTRKERVKLYLGKNETQK